MNGFAAYALNLVGWGPLKEARGLVKAHSSNAATLTTCEGEALGL